MSQYKLDGEVVNKDTLIVTLVARSLFFLAAIFILAAVSPLSLAECFGYAAVVILIGFARSTTLTFSDK